MYAVEAGGPEVVAHMARIGCRLFLADNNGRTEEEWCQNLDTLDLLMEINECGDWSWYVATRRMAYVFIRHEVSKSYIVLEEGHDDRELLHLVFGRNRAIAVDAAAPTSHGERLEAAADQEPKAMLELPDVVFRLVCRFLE